MATYDKDSGDKLPRFHKDPNAILDYSINWGKYWLNDGDEIDSSSWTIIPDHSAGLTIDSYITSSTASKAIVSGGAEGREYRLTNRINTTDGLREDQTLIIEIEEQ